MKRYLISSVLTLFIVSITFGQIPNWTHLTLLAGKSTDYGVAICTDLRNNYYITGTFQNVKALGDDSLVVDCKAIPPPAYNSINGYILRYDSTKTRTLALTVSNGLLGETAVDGSGNIFVSGGINDGDRRDGFLSKYDTAGNELWRKYVLSYFADGRPDDNIITSLDIAKDGSLVVAGISYGDVTSVFGENVSGPSDFVAKLDVVGNVAWIYQSTSNLGLGITKVKFDNAGDVIVAGNDRDNITNGTIAEIGKLSGTTGNVIWKKLFSTSDIYTGWFRAIGTCADGYIFGGEFGDKLVIDASNFHSRGNYDLMLLKTDKAGNIVWMQQGGSTGRDKVLSIACDTNNIAYVTGEYSDGFRYDSVTLASKGFTDAYIMAVDNLGEIVWIKYGGSNITGHTEDLFYEEYGAGITIDSKKEIQIVGTTRGTGNFGSLVFAAPEDAEQNAFWLSLGKSSSTDTAMYPCNKQAVSIPDIGFFVLAFPNPFSTMVKLRNSQNKMVDYNIALYSAIGQKLSNEKITGSEVTIHNWNTLSKGIYFLSVQVDNYRHIFKMIKL